MKGQIAPVKVSDLVPFSSSLNSSFTSTAPKTTFAGISKNGLWMWVVCDTVINIYHTENSEWFGGYCFGESLKRSSAKITAVTEFCSSHISFPCLLIAVNHDHESLICMFDINVSKVVRAVLVPDMVLSLEVVSGNGGACMDTHHLFVQLRYMFGIVAVGTSAGHLYFLDLCLDEDFSCNENLPNITFILKKYELLPEHREMALSRQQHILMLLNDQSTRNGSFEFESRSSSLGHFPHGEVHVTALKYIQSTVTLAMGFNFGGIQLWDLQDLCLLYTVANQPQEQPIIAFAFQEPENDPRHFCYLWIIRGHLANERPEDFSVATMYSLIYGKRTYVESFGNLYTDLRNCTKRFEYRLTSDPYSSAQSSSAAGSCLVSCQTVCQLDETHFGDTTSANESDAASENMSLCFLSWLVWSTSDNFPTSYHLALFDLNQWYRAEMPSSNLRCDPSDLNPYFAHFSLEEVAQIFDLEPILGVYGIPQSIKKFKFITPSEEFFFPSSQDFQAVLFSTSGICKTTFMGLQKRLLYEMADMAPNVLVNPKDFYSDLIRCGLISDLHGTSERVPLVVQREALLQLALEYHLPFFFMKCLKEWRYADSIQEGCTSRALLNWAWKKVIYIKNSIDRLSLPLFNCSGCDVDKASLKCLYSYRRQLDLIDTILMGYQKFATPRTEQGIQELKCRKDVVFFINTYLQVLLWLRTVHVLPEVCEGEETEKNVLYPVNALKDSYFKRRSQLQKIHNSIGSTDILLIDGLVKEAFCDNTWQEKGGNSIYPPPSIYAALSCYLLDDVHLELKHSLMYYLLLDVCNTPSNINSPLAAEVKKFPVVFGMSQSVSKLVKAFWYLDQFNFEVAIKKLLHPAVKVSDILPWQHHRVIKSFLFQREAQKALKYINHMDPPENSIEDMKLHLSVLLSRGAVTQAFYYQRSKQSEGFGKDLLNHLFLGCQETHRLKDLMYLPLNSLESSTLVQFLSENEDPRAQEALVMYYLLRCNFFEAAKVNGKISMSLLGKSASTNQRTVGRDALVEGLLASVPKTEKDLIEEINRFPSYPIQRGDILQPLSLSIRNAPLKQITYSDILNSLFSEASSAMCAPYVDPQTPFKSGTKSCFDNIPFLRPPLTPERTRVASETVYITPVAKRTLMSPASEFSSPSKKSRLLDNAPFKLSSLTKKKIPKHLAGDVVSLLQSPPIHRRGSKLFKESKDISITAPQGILKKKAEPSKFPLSDTYTSRTPSVLSDAGEDSDSEEGQDEKMAVDEVLEDIPGRQIRFSVPRKEDSNASVLCMDAETSANDSEASNMNALNDPSNFIKKIEELKPISSLRASGSYAREFDNVTQRKKTLLNLTREPLKAYSKQSLEKRFTSLEKQTLEKLSATERVQSTSFSSSLSQYSSEPKVTAVSELVDISDSDSCSSIQNPKQKLTICEDVEPAKSSSETTSFQSSSNIYVSTPKQSNLKAGESEFNPSSNICSTESVLNISGSSGNSSYNSASERSFIITPRRPLRDNSKNVSGSDTSLVSAVEGGKEAILLGSGVGISDEEDNDVSIIGEVSVPPSRNIDAEQGETVAEKCSTSEDIPIPKRPSIESVEEIDNQFSASEVEICEVPNYTVTCDKSSYVVELVEDSENDNHDDIPVNVSLSVQEDIEEIDGSASETVTAGEEKVEVIDVVVSTARDVIDLIEKQVDKAFESLPKSSRESSPCVPRSPLKDSPESLHKSIPKSTVKEVSESPAEDVPEMFDISKDVSHPSIPAYVPLKERIKFSHISDSESTKCDDSEEETYPSLLMKEQMEFQTQGQILENKEAVDCKEQPITLESVEKSKSIEESSKHEDMETEIHATENLADSLSPPTLTSTQKFSERFDFLSRHSDIYENNKLYKETVNLLKESDIPPGFEFNPGKKSRKTRTFVFEKVETSTAPSNVLKIEGLHSKTGNEPSSTKSFLESWQPESYEQFSYSIQKGSSDDGEKKNIKSSPNATPETSSVSLFNESSVSVQSVSGMRGRKKKQDATKKDTPVDKCQKSAVKKAKSKGKFRKKMEFSFAEPHSPAGPEILEALTTPSEYPIGSFMFSPPLTRGRLRQKRIDETFSSSFASVSSEVSFVQSKKPPVDPILKEIMAEKTPEPRKFADVKTTVKSSAKKKSVVRKTTRASVSELEAADTSVNTSKLVEETEDLSTSKVLSSVKHVPKHRMVLRQTKAKPRTEQLF